MPQKWNEASESQRRGSVAVLCGCAGVGGGYIVESKMTANFSRFGFTFRYWRTIAGPAD